MFESHKEFFRLFQMNLLLSKQYLVRLSPHYYNDFLQGLLFADVISLLDFSPKVLQNLLADQPDDHSKVSREEHGREDDVNQELCEIDNINN